VQKYLYDNFSKSQGGIPQEVANPENKEKQQHVFQSLQYLRKLCNHPSLVLKDKNAIEAALKQVGQKEPHSLNGIHHAPKLLALR
jgi:TATA-binding protein-associated factor